MAADPRRPLSELVFLDRGPVVIRATIVVLAAVLAGAGGDALYRAQAQLALRLARGATLNPLQSQLAHGSSARTAWVGWAAAAFFALAATRLRRGPSEPPLGRRPLEQLSPTQLRAGLRREYTLARVLLVAVALVTAVDAARVLALLTASAGRSTTLVASGVEVLGLGAATLALALWAWWFSADLRRLGAL